MIAAPLNSFHRSSDRRGKTGNILAMEKCLMKKEHFSICLKLESNFPNKPECFYHSIL